MSNYNDEDLLGMVEMYAEEASLIDSEEALSQSFDNMLEECAPDFPLDDGPALDEAFNNWTDGLCQDGEIHPIQCNEYTYVGRH